MLLERLVQHAQSRNDLPPPYHRPKTVHWALDTTPHPNAPAFGFLDLRPAQGEKPRLVNAPDTMRTSAPSAPFLLVDSAEYVLGIPRIDPGADEPTEKAKDRAQMRHSDYLSLLTQWAHTVPDDKGAQAAVQLLHAGIPAGVLPNELTAADTIAVTADGEWLHERPSVAAFWAGEVQKKKAKSGAFGICLVCGGPGALVDSLPDSLMTGAFPKTEGLDKKAKAQLISVNAAAFERAGGEQLASTPVCAPCGSQAMTALNALLADDRHRLRVAPSVMVWWTREPTIEALLEPLEDPQPEDIASLLATAHKPNDPMTPVDTNAFHAVTLGLNSSRVVVRDWIDVPVLEARRGIGRWLADHRIADPWTGTLTCYPLWLLGLSTGRWQNIEEGRGTYVTKSVPHGVPADLARAALRGTAPDSRTLLIVLQRIRADHRIDGPRAALLRLMLTRSTPTEDPPMPELNELETDSAYLSGRAFAILESIQRATMPNVNTTIADKYLSNAMTSPGTVLPGLRINASNHLRRLRRDNPGAAYALETRLGETFAQINEDIPAFMTPKQQARFVLGYEHQRAQDARARKAAGGNLPTARTSDTTAETVA
ncbi:type I-C CRISPR-associated protein Cas8c/Csd1 [Streptomyces globisporus]|uniref:type I-C CRISPR-associated protein Cas8c/Csd1 n=1 Tax=Streptomyces globisporus TaxID=1908 RepID=UPI00345FFAF9